MFKSAFQKKKSPKLMETPSNKKVLKISIRVWNTNSSEKSRESIEDRIDYIFVIIFLFMFVAIFSLRPQIVNPFGFGKAGFTSKKLPQFL